MFSYQTYLWIFLLQIIGLSAQKCGKNFVNWKQITMKNVDGLNLISSNSAYVRDLNTKFKSINLPTNSQTTTMKKKVNDYDYDIQTDIQTVSIHGFQGIDLHKFYGLTSHELRALAVLSKSSSMNLKIKMKVKISQNGDCKSTEEKYGGLCYKKCSILTNGEYPLRTATNTCSMNGCGPNEEKNGALCYPKCKPKYKGVGPVCWGRCDQLYGPKFTDTGLTCHRWWWPLSKSKPSYGRGVGRVPYKPWTKGFGCNGFGTNADGGCATPVCGGEKFCKPETVKVDLNLKVKDPRMRIVGDLELRTCKKGEKGHGCSYSPAQYAYKIAESGMSSTSMLGRIHRASLKSFDLYFGPHSIQEFEATFGGNILSAELKKELEKGWKKSLSNGGDMLNQIKEEVEVQATNLANDYIVKQHKNDFDKC